jgi:hypothetical protein
MARYSYALVLLASSIASAHVFPRQVISSNVTTIVVPTQTSTRAPGPTIVTETPVTSGGDPTKSAHTERTAITLDSPAGVSDTTTSTSLYPPKTVHGENTETSLDRPPVPTGGTFTTELTAHVEKTQTDVDHPGSISWITVDSNIHVTLSMPRTENSQATLDVPRPTKPKAVTQVPASSLDVPVGPPTTMNQPGTADPIGKPGQTDNLPRPEGASGKPDDGDGQSSAGGNEGPPGSGRPEDNQGAPGTQNTARPTAGGAGGLISAIQSVATKQAGVPQNDQNDNPNGPVAVVTAAPISKPSVTGFAIGTQTASPGGAALTQGGSTFSALPSGAGLQVVANGQIATVSGASPSSSPVVHAGGDDGEYVLGGNTLTVGGKAVTSGGATFSALPDGGGVLVVSNGHTSRIPLGEAADVNTFGSDSSLPTPVILPANAEQPITIGDKTYTAQITAGSLLVLGSQTIRPGFTTVINGETLLLTGSNLLLATGTSTSTRGLGGSIMSDLGGESESGGKKTSSTASQSSDSSTAAAATAEPSSGAEQRSLSDMRVLLGGILSFVFALVLM